MTPQEVDTLNVFQARMKGFKRAIEILSKRTKATYAVIDGHKIPEGLNVDTDCLVKGDEKLACISAASILAKVTKELLMIEQLNYIQIMGLRNIRVKHYKNMGLVKFID